MKTHELNHRKSRRLVIDNFRTRDRIAFGFVGLLIACDGLITLLAGRMHYPNHWGAPVFAPFALVIGVIAIAVAIVKRNSIN